MIFTLILLVIGIILIALLRQFTNRLIYPAPPASRPWGDLVLKRPDVTLRGWITNPGASDAWIVFGGNGLALPPVADAWRDCTDRAMYLMPYRGYEGQAGQPSEKALVADGVALVQMAQKTHRRVGIIGISLGTGVATQVAVQVHPDKLLLITPYDRLDLVAHDHFPYLPTSWLMRDNYDSASAAKQLNGIPVALLQADNDEIIFAARTRALADALPTAPTTWRHVPTTHNGVWDSPELCRFIRDGG
jgi:uncharacterized protein